jgi:hypothetical protein
MLVNTNDGFFAVDTEALPRFRGGSRTYYAVAYDAGSELNNEHCDFVPGPACEGISGENYRAVEGAEGFVYVHNGVHGIADLEPTMQDWNNPVAKVVVTRIQ